MNVFRSMDDLLKKAETSVRPTGRRDRLLRALRLGHRWRAAGAPFIAAEQKSFFGHLADVFRWAPAKAAQLQKP